MKTCKPTTGDDVTSPCGRRPARERRTPCGFKILPNGRRLKKYERAPKECVTFTYPCGWRIAYP